MEALENGDFETKKKKHKGKHDKPKPWDEDPNIDHWKIDKFDPSWNESGMLEVSSFSTLFPKYRGVFFFFLNLFHSCIRYSIAIVHILICAFC